MNILKSEFKKIEKNKFSTFFDDVKKVQGISKSYKDFNLKFLKLKFSEFYNDFKKLQDENYLKELRKLQKINEEKIEQQKRIRYEPKYFNLEKYKEAVKEEEKRQEKRMLLKEKQKENCLFKNQQIRTTLNKVIENNLQAIKKEKQRFNETSFIAYTPNFNQVHKKVLTFNMSKQLPRDMNYIREEHKNRILQIQNSQKKYNFKKITSENSSQFLIKKILMLRNTQQNNIILHDNNREKIAKNSIEKIINFTNKNLYKRQMLNYKFIKKKNMLVKSQTGIDFNKSITIKGLSQFNNNKSEADFMRRISNIKSNMFRRTIKPRDSNLKQRYISNDLCPEYNTEIANSSIINNLYKTKTNLYSSYNTALQNNQTSLINSNDNSTITNTKSNPNLYTIKNNIIFPDKSGYVNIKNADSYKNIKESLKEKIYKKIQLLKEKSFGTQAPSSKKTNLKRIINDKPNHDYTPVYKKKKSQIRGYDFSLSGSHEVKQSEKVMYNRATNVPGVGVYNPNYNYVYDKTPSVSFTEGSKCLTENQKKRNKLRKIICDFNKKGKYESVEQINANKSSISNTST